MNRRTLLIVLAALTVSAQPASSQSTPSSAATSDISQVWEREAEYWRYVKTGNVDAYVKLWHDKFIGWPCGTAHPKRKESIGDWVREVRDKRIDVAVDMTQEGAEDFGDIVVVHYSFTRVDTYPDGKVEGKGKQSKITHTWLKQGNEWLIIGGMCGTLSDVAK